MFISPSPTGLSPELGGDALAQPDPQPASQQTPDAGVNTPGDNIRYPRDFHPDTSNIEYVKFTFWKYKEGKGQLGQGGSIGSDNYYTDESIYEPAGGFPESKFYIFNV